MTAAAMRTATAGAGAPVRTSSRAPSINSPKPSDQPTPSKPATVCTSSMVGGSERPASRRQAASTLPAGPGSSPGWRSNQASRNAASSSARPSSVMQALAAFSASRCRHAPFHSDSARTRLSSAFKALPAMKAASTGSSTRARGIAHAGTRGTGRGTGDASWSWRLIANSINAMCGLCHYFQLIRTACRFKIMTDKIALSVVFVFI